MSLSKFMREKSEPEGRTCEMSLFEVCATLQHVDANPTGEVEQLVADQMRALLLEQQKGNITFRPDWPREEQNVVSQWESCTNATSHNNDEPLRYVQPDANARYSARNFPVEQRKKISEMDYEALTKVIPEGKITPASREIMYPTGQLRVPIPNGHALLPTQKSNSYNISQFAKVEEANGDRLSIQYPIRSDILRVPWGMIPVGSDAPLNIYIPTRESPVVWSAQRSSPHSGQSENLDLVEIDAAKRPKVDMQSLAVSEDERRYWRSVLPLPASLQEVIDEQEPQSQERVHLVLAYLAHRSNDEKLTNFRYVCHPRLGRFFRENADDLPLLMSELKMGHCDLLAWYTAAQLRAQGIPAWTQAHAVPVPSGNAFNAAFEHTVVQCAVDNGVIYTCDPTTRCDVDTATHPDALSNSTIDSMENDFLNAPTLDEKCEVLKQFRRTLDEQRNDASCSNSGGRITHDMLRVSLNYQSSFALQDSPCIDSRLASWLPISAEEPENTIQLLSSIFCNSYQLVALQDEVLTVGNTRIERRLLATFFQAIKKGGYRFQPDTAFLSDAAEEIIGTEQEKTKRILEFPVQRTVAMVSAKQFLSKDLMGAFINEKGMQYFFTDSLRYRITDFNDWELFSQHEFSEPFKKLLSKGLLLNNYYNENESIEFYRISDAEPPEINKNEIVSLLVDTDAFSALLQLYVNRKISAKQIEVAVGIPIPQIQKFIKHMCPFIVARDAHQKPRNTLRSLNTADNLSSPLQYTSKDHERVAHTVNRELARLIGSQQGAIVTPDDTRRYTQGDDTRHIDWSAFARHDELYIRNHPIKSQEEHKRITLLLDIWFSGRSVFSYTILQSIVHTVQSFCRARGLEVDILDKEGKLFQVPLHVPSSCLLSFIPCSQLDPVGICTEKPLRVPSDSRLLYITDRPANALIAQHCWRNSLPMAAIDIRSEPYSAHLICKEKWVQSGICT